MTEERSGIDTSLHERFVKQETVDIGTTVYNKAGISGVVQGVEERNGVSYVRTQLQDGITSLIPKVNFDKVYSLTTPTPQEIHHPKLTAFLEYVRENQTYSTKEFSFPDTDPQLKGEVTLLLEEAKAHNYLFRGDGRHPYGEGIDKHDTEKIAEPFNTGFTYEPDQTIFGGVTLTANLRRALDYPHDWDGEKYLYMINPRSLLKQPEQIQLKDLQNDEVVLNAIAPKDITYALKVTNYTEVVGIMKIEKTANKSE